MKEFNGQDSKMTLQPKSHDNQTKERFPNLPTDTTTFATQESEDNSPSKRTKARKVSTSGEGGQGLTPEQLEAKRITNRLSARRCRLRQKNLIKDLQDENSLLKMENKNLRLRLELSLAEAKKLELTHDQEMRKLALKRSHARECMAQKRAQGQPKPRMTSIPAQSSATTASALLQLAASNETPELVPQSPPPTNQSRTQVAAPMLPRLPSNLIASELSSSLAERRRAFDTQQQIENLRNEVKIMKEFLARHSV